MDGGQVGVLEEADQVSLGSLLQGQHGGALEAEVSLELLGDLTDQALEGQLADEEISALLVATDLTQGHSTRAVTVGLLHASGGGGGLTGSLGGELLTGSPAIRGKEVRKYIEEGRLVNGVVEDGLLGAGTARRAHKTVIMLCEIIVIMHYLCWI